jgi:4-hydroxybenzoate polyprenyltransferase
MKASCNTATDLKWLLAATLLFGASNGIFVASFNNYLSDIHQLNAAARGWLEFPREFPGFLLMLISAGLLTFMRETRIAAFAMLMTAIGAIGLGLFARDTVFLVLFLILWSLGDHIIFAVEDAIGLRLAQNHSPGRRLGQIGAARNLGIIIGVGIMALMARRPGDRYELFYILAALFAGAAAGAYLKLNPRNNEKPSRRLVFHRHYTIYYAISALFGMRKQIFLAFGAWVLVTLHDVNVATIATLYFIASALGVFLRPLLGDIIDWFGERLVLAVDELLLILVCLAYAFSGDLFSPSLSRWILYGAFILDSVLFSLRIARNTYLKKIALDPAHITPTMATGVTVDHLVAMSLPVLSGYIWSAFGFRWVFLLAAAIGLGGFFVCLQIRIPEQSPTITESSS